MDRINICEECVETERDYCEDLRTVIDVFIVFIPLFQVFLK